VRDALLVMAGGAFGSLLRWSVGRFVPPPASGWPLATWLVNVAGAFVLALLAASPAFALGARPALRLLVVTGVLGGFTTYSAFNQETLAALVHGRVARGLGYAAATLCGALASGLCGHLAGRWLSSSGS
jgi:CrcB protein